MGIPTNPDQIFGEAFNLYRQAYNPFQAEQAGLREQDFGGDIQNQREAYRAASAGAGNTWQQQQQFIQALQNQMAGQGPSLAQMQLTRGAEDATKRAAGQIGSMGGLNPALQARMVAESNAGQQLGLAGMAGQQRLQEQLATQNLLGQTLSGVRGQDISQQQLGLEGITSLGGLAGAQQGRALQNWQQTQGLNAEVASQNQQALLNLNQQVTGIRNAQAERNMAQQAAKRKMIGGALNAIGGAMSFIPGIGTAAGAVTKGVGGAVAGGAKGGMVPGHDSEKYDTVHAMLSPGEIVLPRSVTQKDNAPERARSFVEEIQRRAKGGKVSSKEPNYGPVLAKLRKIKSELEALGV